MRRTGQDFHCRHAFREFPVMLTESFRVVRGNSRVGKAITCEQSGRKESGQIHNKQECHELINPDRNSPVIGKTVKPQY